MCPRRKQNDVQSPLGVAESPRDDKRDNAQKQPVDGGAHGIGGVHASGDVDAGGGASGGGAYGLGGASGYRGYGGGYSACVPAGTKHPNVKFYRGELRSSEGSIQELHGWRGNYHELETSHAYVQWFFPNYFESRFNADSFALTPEEAAIFRSDRDIAEKYLQSYEIWLDFIGLQVFDRKTGAVGRQDGSEDRLVEALVHHPHNRLRIRRILASLAVCGFRQYMAPLVHHIEWEITGANKNVMLPDDVRVYEEGRRGQHALRSLASDPRCLETWLLYVDGNPEHFQQNTKAVPADAEPSILFSLELP